MIFQRFHFIDEKIRLFERYSSNASVDYSYTQYSLCDDTRGDLIVSILGLPCIVIGVILIAFYLLTSLLNRDLFSRTSLFEDSFVCTNAINFIVTSVAAVEYSTNECWNASSAACKISVWSSEVTATGAVGFLILVATSSYHPWIQIFFKASTVRKYGAVIAVCVTSFFLTIPEIFLAEVKEFLGDKFCIFSADIPSRYKLVLKKDLLTEYVLPILITLCILMHSSVVIRGRRTENQTRPQQTSSQSVNNIGRNIFLEKARIEVQHTENNERSSHHTALVLMISFLLLKTPHHVVTLVDAFEITLRSFQIRLTFDFIEMITCILFAGISPLLVLTGSTVQRRRAKKTFEIMKTFLNGRRWQQGFEMDLRN